MSTLRRWDNNDKFSATFKTVGGHRRYNWNRIRQFMMKNGKNDDKDLKNEGEKITAKQDSPTQLL